MIQTQGMPFGIHQYRPGASVHRYSIIYGSSLDVHGSVSYLKRSHTGVVNLNKR